MTADDPHDFAYEARDPEADKHKLRRYWSIAKGIQKVDGLDTSCYLDELISDNLKGSRDLADTGKDIRRYHRAYLNDSAKIPDLAVGDGACGVSAEEAQADLVSHRIVELLATGAFVFSPLMLDRIHAHLFQDLDEDIYHPGIHKDIALQKQEAILNGDSVLYADPSLVDASLKMAFEDEMGSVYGKRFDPEQLRTLARFISRLWQVHPYFEGNTRTVAVFAILYLNDLGYDIDNTPFEENSVYFRDSLVRAVYRNPKADAFPEMEYLIAFLDNALNQECNDLVNEDLKVVALFEDPLLLRNVPSSDALSTRSDA